MTDPNRVQIEITADDSKVRPAIERTNSTLQRMEEMATRATRSIGNTFSAIDRTIEHMARTTVNVASGIVAIAGAWDIVANATKRAAVATAEYKTVGEKLVNEFRAVRLAYGATQGVGAFAGAAAGVGVGLALQYGVSAVMSRNREIEAAALAGGGQLQGYRDSLTMSRVSSQLGRDYSVFGNSSYETLRNSALELSTMRDPIARAEYALAQFGANAGSALSMLDSRFLNSGNLHESRLSNLSQSDRQNIATMVQDLRDAGKRFGMILDDAGASVKSFGDRVAAGFASVWAYLSSPGFASSASRQNAAMAGFGSLGGTSAPNPATDIKGDLGGLLGRMSPSSPGAASLMAQRALGQRQIEEINMRPLIEARDRNIQSLLDQFDREGMQPLARLFFDLTKRLQEIVASTGGMTVQQASYLTGAYQTAAGRLIQAGAPQAEAMPLGFAFGWQNPTANIVDVPAEAGAMVTSGAQAAMAQNIRMRGNYAASFARLGGGLGFGGQIAGANAAAAALISAANEEGRASGADMGQRLFEIEQNRQLELANIIQGRYREMIGDLSSGFSSLFDALTVKGGSAAQAIGNFFRAALLTPIKQAGSMIMSQVMAPLMAPLYGLSGGGGFGGGGMAAGMMGMAAPMMAASGGEMAGPGAQMAQNSAVGGGMASGVGGVANAAMGRAFTGGLAGMSSMVYNSGLIRLSSGIGGATTAAGIGGFSGTMAGIASSPAAGLAGAMMVPAGFKMGNWGGLAMSAGGGALAGFMIGSKIGLAGGPIGAIAGALIGAAVGGGIGLIGMLREKPWEKAAKRVREVYGVGIDRQFAQQLADTARGQFGNNIDMAIRSPQIQELIYLYAQATGQKMNGFERYTPLNLTQSGGSIFQEPAYLGNSPFTQPGVFSPRSLPSLGPSAGPAVVNATFVLGGNDVNRAFSGQVVRTISASPGVVQNAVAKGQRLNISRQNAGLALNPIEALI